MADKYMLRVLIAIVLVIAFAVPAYADIPSGFKEVEDSLEKDMRDSRERIDREKRDSRKRIDRVNRTPVKKKVVNNRFYYGISVGTVNFGAHKDFPGSLSGGIGFGSTLKYFGKNFGFGLDFDMTEYSIDLGDSTGDGSSVSSSFELIYQFNNRKTSGGLFYVSAIYSTMTTVVSYEGGDGEEPSFYGVGLGYLRGIESGFTYGLELKYLLSSDSDSLIQDITLVNLTTGYSW